MHKRAVPAPEDLTALVLGTLDDNKAEEIVLLPLEGKTDIARVMIVASGRSARHVGALADYVERSLRESGVRPTVEGVPACDWVLLDTGDLIVHLFRPEVRTYYNLEKMWGPAIAHRVAGSPDETDAETEPGIEPCADTGNQAEAG